MSDAMPPQLSPPPGWMHVRRVLLVRLDNIGDVVMLAPAVQALRRALPEASLTLLASPAGAQAAPLLDVDEVIEHRALWQDASGRLPLDPPRERAFIERLCRGRYDAAVIFTSFSQSPFPPALACYLAGIPIRLGASRLFGGGVLSPQVSPPADDVQQADRNLLLLRQAGFRTEGCDAPLQVPARAQARADALLGECGLAPGDAFVLLAPGATAAARRYAPERYAAAARRVARSAGLPIVVAGGERDADCADAVLEALGDAPASSLVGRTSVPELAGLIARSALVLCNNSGPMHIADSLRRPLVVLYSGTDLEGQWRPRRAPAIVLRRETSCTPCYGFDCPREMECLDVPPDEVAHAAQRALAGAR